MKQYIIRLSASERRKLKEITRKGVHGARVLKRAQVLLKSHHGMTDEEITAQVGVGLRTVSRIRQRYCTDGLPRALEDAPRPGTPPALNDTQEARLVAIACSDPPEGHHHWTMDLLTERLIRDGTVDSVSRSTIHTRLVGRGIQPWREKMWCIPTVDAPYIERMEDLLALYAKPHNPAAPVLCFDEGLVQLTEDTRPPVSTKPQVPRKRDYEYRRKGTANCFVTVEPRGGFRTVRVTARRTKRDFAEEIARIVGLERYRDATTIHLVLDNLNTHFPRSFHETFGAAVATRLLDRITFHYTPKHGSWLNMAEIEIGILHPLPRMHPGAPPSGPGYAPSVHPRVPDVPQPTETTDHLAVHKTGCARSLRRILQAKISWMRY